MSGNNHLSLPELAGLDCHQLAGVLVANQAKLVWKLLIKTAVQPVDEISSRDIKIGILTEADLYCPLAVDMCEAFFLQVTLGGIFRIVLPHGTFNINGMGAMPFNKVGIIAVNQAQEINNRLLRHWMQLAAKGSRTADYFAGHIFKLGHPAWKKRFHL